MALPFFDKPVYAQNKHFVQEITGLDDTFDLLEDWPAHKRTIAYDTLKRYCHRAASGEWPVWAARDNLARFLKQHGKLAQIEDAPPRLRPNSGAKIGGR